ncbi:tripartite tricarboxylate transporter TctB family protein [Bacillus taeanensis]|uniref:DUF1468 domain-containing protein n=1 Tax=Bacillus taeanensis TaxID=273032 RepID=A0A366XWV6_9BACI|nr:tripartite tricarboxylate transporter TctB family protein [Bacillus taeanensis]RBW68623.1 hypothetical protein DS031_15815 [Bacillus taeanensis]
MGEVIFHIILMIVIGLFLKESYGIPDERASDPIGPAGFPQALLYLALVLMTISLIKAIKKWKAEGNKADKETVLTPTVVGVLVSIIVFIVLVEYLGFILGSVFLLFSLFYLLGQRNWTKITVQSLVLPFGFAFVFGNILSVPLPRGYDVIKALSYFIY